MPESKCTYMEGKENYGRGCVHWETAWH